jgi:ATP-dependent DNA ligase
MRRRLICLPRRSSWWFDCLQARGKDLRSQPLYVRRNVIEDVLDEQDRVLPVRRLADDGLKAWQQVIERGYEGLVAKDPASPWVGARSNGSR